MTGNKEEIYNELLKRGIKPPKTLRFSKLEDLEAMLGDSKLNDTAVHEPKRASAASKSPNKAEIHTLVFDSSGWCEELKTSYFNGVYRPVTVKEYLILRKFAAREI